MFGKETTGLPGYLREKWRENAYVFQWTIRRAFIEFTEYGSDCRVRSASPTTFFRAWACAYVWPRINWSRWPRWIKIISMHCVRHLCVIAFVILAVTRHLRGVILPFRRWSLGFVISKRSKIAKSRGYDTVDDCATNSKIDEKESSFKWECISELKGELNYSNELHFWNDYLKCRIIRIRCYRVKVAQFEQAEWYHGNSRLYMTVVV